MKHLRDDYNRIQDPNRKIGDDEPVFLLRGQDKAFPAMLLGYIGYQRAVGNEALAKFIEDQMPAVHQWRASHHCKQADIPPGTKPGLANEKPGVKTS
jgi:hypothetical protein